MKSALASLPCLLVLCGWLLPGLPGDAVAGAGNFTSNDPAITAAAEQARIDSARFWTGRELPGRWSHPCPITLQPADHSGGGRTSFHFDRGEVSGWSMTIVGRREALLFDVIPHEVDHMVRASLVRRPVPRWLDEGCATLLESPASHQQFRERLHRHSGVRLEAAFLDSGDYPTDGTALDRLYVVGFSLVEFLLTRRDAATLLAFQSDPRPPSRKLHDFYGLDVETLDRSWRAWCQRRDGSRLDCVSVACAHHGVRPTPQTTPLPSSSVRETRPRLTIYTAHWCVPCRKFWSDYRNEASFRAALDRSYCLEVIDVERYPEMARARQIEAVPAFETGQGRLYGYEGTAWLLARLAAVKAEPDIATSEPSTGVTPAAPAIPFSRTPAPSTPGAVTDAVTNPPVTAPTTVALSEAPSRVSDLLLRAAVTLFPWGEVAGLLGLSVATGGTGALALAAGVGLWRRIRRRRRRTAITPHVTPVTGGAASGPAPFPRALDEARQLLELRQSEGRVAVLDALRGMFLDDELHKAVASASPEEAAALNRLQVTLDARVQEVAPLSVRLEE